MHNGRGWSRPQAQAGRSRAAHAYAPGTQPSPAAQLRRATVLDGTFFMCAAGSEPGNRTCSYLSPKSGSLPTMAPLWLAAGDLWPPATASLSPVTARPWPLHAVHPLAVQSKLCV